MRNRDSSNWAGFGCPECQNAAHQDLIETQFVDGVIVAARRCNDCHIDYDVFYKLSHAVVYEHGPGRLMVPMETVIPKPKQGAS